MKEDRHVPKHRGVLPRIVAEQLLAHSVRISAVEKGVLLADDADAVLLARKGAALCGKGVPVSEDVLNDTVGKTEVCSVQNDGQIGRKEKGSLNDPDIRSRSGVPAWDHELAAPVLCGVVDRVLEGLAVAFSEEARFICINGHRHLTHVDFRFYDSIKARGCQAHGELRACRNL